MTVPVGRLVKTVAGERDDERDLTAATSRRWRSRAERDHLLDCRDFASSQPWRHDDAADPFAATGHAIRPWRRKP